MNTEGLNYSGSFASEFHMRRARTVFTIGFVVCSIGLAMIVAGAVSAVFVIGPGLIVLFVGFILMYTGHRKTLEAKRQQHTPVQYHTYAATTSTQPDTLQQTYAATTPIPPNIPQIVHSPVLLYQQSSVAGVHNDQQGSFVTSTYWVPGPEATDFNFSPARPNVPPPMNLPPEPPPYEVAAGMK